MPLGLVHKIKPVTSGFRISYTKSVYVQTKAEQPQIETPTNSGDLWLFHALNFLYIHVNHLHIFIYFNGFELKEEAAFEHKIPI